MLKSIKSFTTSVSKKLSSIFAAIWNLLRAISPETYYQERAKTWSVAVVSKQVAQYQKSKPIQRFIHWLFNINNIVQKQAWLKKQSLIDPASTAATHVPEIEIANIPSQTQKQPVSTVAVLLNKYEEQQKITQWRIKHGIGKVTEEQAEAILSQIEFENLQIRFENLFEECTKELIAARATQEAAMKLLEEIRTSEEIEKAKLANKDYPELVPSLEKTPENLSWVRNPMAFNGILSPTSVMPMPMSPQPDPDTDMPTYTEDFTPTDGADLRSYEPSQQLVF